MSKKVIVIFIVIVFGFFLPNGRVHALSLDQEFATLPCTPTNNANLQISGGTSTFGISIGTNLKNSGAIISMKINGQEIVNATDLGRDMQYAFQVGNTGEANNPTEAGSRNGVSSTFLGGCVSGNILYTKSKMAYWIPLNGKTISDYILEKKVQIGFNGMPNVIRFSQKVTLAETGVNLRMEIPTGYHAATFTQVTLLNRTTKILRASTPSDFVSNLYNTFDRAYIGGTDIPVMSNGQFSVAPYSPYAIAYMYGQSVAGKTNKWSIRGSLDSAVAGTNFFSDAYLVTGSSATQVAGDVKKLMVSDPPLDSPPIGGIENISSGGIVNGWAADPDIGDSSVNVHLYLDGDSATGLNLAAVTAKIIRNDIFNQYGFGKNSGFQYQIPADKISDGKDHKIYVYAINKNKNGAFATPNVLINSGGTLLPKYVPALSPTLSPTPSPTPTFAAIPGDVTDVGDVQGDQVNIFDYNLVLSNFGNPYTIFDYNDVVGNFSK